MVKLLLGVKGIDVNAKEKPDDYAALQQVALEGETETP